MTGCVPQPTRNTTCLEWSEFPHSTVIPGLQFFLAGIIGKPETFYDVPLVRFVFEVFSFL